MIYKNRLGDYEKAIALLKKAAEMEPMMRIIPAMPKTRHIGVAEVTMGRQWDED